LGLSSAIDLVLISSLQFKQSLADLICRTLVVNAPPPRPHRAPAGPMHSSLDAEFGPRRRRLSQRLGSIMFHQRPNPSLNVDMLHAWLRPPQRAAG
jgi:hypothetical protein